VSWKAGKRVPVPEPQFSAEEREEAFQAAKAERRGRTN
jgi:hypothetical protein